MSFPYHNVLFLCRGNAVRSQMAEALFRSMAPDNVSVWSAGLSPIGVAPQAKQVIEELGLNMAEQFSKGVDEVPSDEIDLVITLCDMETEPCPVFPNKTTELHWPMSDPYMAPALGEDGLDSFRSVRDEIKQKLEKLLSNPSSFT